ITSDGTSMTGIHHASRMLPSMAPTRIAIFSPSPVLVLIETGCVRGPRANARTIASFHSNPPVARMTLPARTSNGPSRPTKRTPSTAPLLMINSVAPGAQFTIGKGRAFERAAPLGFPAGKLWMVIGKVGDGIEMHRRALGKKIEHFRAGANKGRWG